MADRQITASNLPVVTPPWLQNTASPAKNTGQQSAQQQPSMPGQKVDYLGIAGKLFGKTAFNAAKPFFAAGGAATGIGGAATGGLTAGGGTYVTGSGLAGSASAINTTAGAAGGVKGAGTISKGLGGVASAGIGLATVAIGNNYFGGHGGTGASIGTAIGSLWGPVGAAVGGLFGGAIGGMFGGGEERAFVGFSQGGGLKKDLTKYQQKFNTSLGPMVIATGNIPSDSVSELKNVFIQSDEAVSKLFSEDQMQRAKQGILNGKWTSTHVDWGQPENADRVDGVIKSAIKDRYALAVGGLDPAYYGTFKRLVTDKNIGGLISTVSHMDESIAEKSGVFSDFNPQANTATIDKNDIRLKPTIQSTKKNQWGIPEPVEIANPKYDASLVESFKNQQGNFRVIGYEPFMRTEKHQAGPNHFQDVQVKDYRPIYEETPSSIGNQALEHIAQKYNITGKPSPPTYKSVPEPYIVMGGVINKYQIDVAEQHNKKAKEGYVKKLTAWEKKVLDTYADNHVQAATAEQLSSNTIIREAEAQAAQPEARTQLFGNIQQQEVKLNRAAPQNNNATDAGLLQRGGLI